MSELRDEIALLKTFIVENHDNATKLQRAEELAEAESREIRLYGEHPSEFSMKNDLPSNPLPPEPPASLPTESNLSDSESEKERHQSHADSISGKANEEHKPRNTAIQIASMYQGILDYDKSRTSTLLLQMIPYQPRPSVPLNGDGSRLLISAEPGAPPRPELNPKPSLSDASQSVRLLLDKWTTSGSAPISNVLDAESAKDSHVR